jgi:hypothetical protein
MSLSADEENQLKSLYVNTAYGIDESKDTMVENILSKPPNKSFSVGSWVIARQTTNNKLIERIGEIVRTPSDHTRFFDQDILPRPISEMEWTSNPSECECILDKKSHSLYFIPNNERHYFVKLYDPETNTSHIAILDEKNLTKTGNLKRIINKTMKKKKQERKEQHDAIKDSTKLPLDMTGTVMEFIKPGERSGGKYSSKSKTQKKKRKNARASNRAKAKRKNK